MMAVVQYKFALVDSQRDFGLASWGILSISLVTCLHEFRLMLYQRLTFCRLFLMCKCYKSFCQVDPFCILPQQGKQKCSISSNCSLFFSRWWFCLFPHDASKNTQYWSNSGKPVSIGSPATCWAEIVLLCKTERDSWFPVAEDISVWSGWAREVSFVLQCFVSTDERYSTYSLLLDHL